MEVKFVLLKTACTGNTGPRGPEPEGPDCFLGKHPRREAVHSPPAMSPRKHCNDLHGMTHKHLLKTEYLHCSHKQRTNAINNKQEVRIHIIPKIIYKTGKILSIIIHNVNENYSHNSMCHFTYTRIILRICQLLIRMWRWRQSELVEV